VVDIAFTLSVLECCHLMLLRKTLVKINLVHHHCWSLNILKGYLLIDCSLSNNCAQYDWLIRYCFWFLIGCFIILLLEIRLDVFWEQKIEISNWTFNTEMCMNRTRWLTGYKMFSSRGEHKMFYRTIQHVGDVGTI